MCEYCDDFESSYDGKYLIESKTAHESSMVYINENYLVLLNGVDESYLQIVYYPMCGKKLSAQEVEPCQTQTE